MISKIRLTTLLIFFLSLSFQSNAQLPESESKVKVRTEKYDLDSENELTDFLENKKKAQEPFDKKKIDVEMLGLDDVEEKSEDKVKEEVKPEPAPEPAPKPIPKPIPKEIPKPIPKQLTNPIQTPEKQEKSTGIFNKIKSFVDKKTDKENKKIILKLGPEKKVKDQTQIDKEKEERERKEKLAAEKKARLDRLREEYLIKISKDGKAMQSEKEIITPKKKQLNWSDSFYKTVDMPPPLLSRSRSADNSHIPTIPTFIERMRQLFSTISTNDISAFNNFYSKIAIPDLRNQKGDTILTYSLLLKRHPVISSILSKGADPDLPNSLGHAPLDIAIENLDLKSVKILIDNHADINYTDKYGRTYLMLAARKGYLPIVQLLVEYGADVNASDSYGRTALTIAYRHKKEIVAKYLIKHGAQAWIEKPYERSNQELIRELENRWRTPTFSTRGNQ